jgi:lipopolysaccharide/colanic/teichoic acid biosynthesis glycosyltransferase
MPVTKRLVDATLSGVALLLAAPLLAVAAVGIRLSSPGPVLFRARLIGRGGRPFTMYKLRTMHVNHGAFRSAITAQDDPRVFPFGAWLRRAKVDELPQLVNILRGDMAIIGPRPEHPDIVRDHYGPEHRELLQIRPGLSSPGTLYDYTHGEALVGRDAPAERYVERLLPMRTALDLVYVRRASLGYDIAIMWRTLRLIAATVLGRRDFPDPPEMPEARRLLAERERRVEGGERSRRLGPPRSALRPLLPHTSFSVRPTFRNASTARSRSWRECAALIWQRTRACPCGTTG